ncbi:unnamed protein product [Heterosigma akashiwo]
MRKRKEFEDSIRRQRQHLGTWHKYAKWEESQKEYERARSIYERALDVDFKSVSLWMKYIEMEMKNKMVNHARNIYDRAVQLLPRVDQFWYKYTYMEEMVGNPKAARTIFERWALWVPRFFWQWEHRKTSPRKSISVMERYVEAHPTQRAFLKYARWEEKQRQRPLARAVYERALRELEEGERGEKLYAAFAKFEEGCKEFERARTIYKFALDQMRREEVPELYQAFLSFEKQHGNREGIEEVIINKRRLQYEEAVSASPLDYDAWFDYVRLEEAEGTLEQAREVYERAIAQVYARRGEKRFWRRYIYLWINYRCLRSCRRRTRTGHGRCSGRAWRRFRTRRSASRRCGCWPRTWSCGARTWARRGGCWARRWAAAARRASSGTTSSSSSRWPYTPPPHSSPSAPPRDRLRKEEVWGRRRGHGPCTSWPWTSRCWTCPRPSGRPTSTWRWRRGPGAQRLVALSGGCWRAAGHASRSGSASPNSRPSCPPRPPHPPPPRRARAAAAWRRRGPCSSGRTARSRRTACARSGCCCWRPGATWRRRPGTRTASGRWTRGCPSASRRSAWSPGTPGRSSGGRSTTTTRSRTTARSPRASRSSRWHKNGRSSRQLLPVAEGRERKERPRS